METLRLDRGSQSLLPAGMIDIAEQYFQSLSQQSPAERGDDASGWIVRLSDRIPATANLTPELRQNLEQLVKSVRELAATKCSTG